MQNGKYIAAVVVGIVAGWVCQDWLYGPSIQDDLAASRSLSIAPPPATDVAVAIEANVANVNLQQTKQTSLSQLTPLRLIEKLSLMDDKTFMEYLNSSNNISQSYSEELLKGMLEELPTISDSASWYRLIDFLRAVRMKGIGQRESTIENTIISKIRNAQQEAYWLDVLSHLGVEKVSNVEFITKHLDRAYDSQSRVSALLALSRNFGLGFHNDHQQESKFNRASVSQKIATYLNSEEDLERAAAIRALERFPSPDYTDRISSALKDPSERVRMSAMMALGGRNKPNGEEIRNSLLVRMQLKEASDLERLTAWRMLKLMPIEGEYYKAVYEFGRSDYSELNKRYRSQARKERSQWGD